MKIFLLKLLPRTLIKLRDILTVFPKILADTFTYNKYFNCLTKLIILKKKTFLVARVKRYLSLLWVRFVKSSLQFHSSLNSTERSLIASLQSSKYFNNPSREWHEWKSINIINKYFFFNRKTKLKLLMGFLYTKTHSSFSSCPI